VFKANYTLARIKPMRFSFCVLVVNKRLLAKLKARFGLKLKRAFCISSKKLKKDKKVFLKRTGFVLFNL